MIIWGAFSYEVINTRLNAAGYQQLIGNELIKLKTRYNNIIFQQDNAPIHVARSTMKRVESHNINVFLPLSPDLNPIENIWRLMARDMYAGGKQFSNVYKL